MAQKKLTAAEIAEGLKKIGSWRQAGEGIERDFLFRDFSEATGFLTRVALLSEKLDHHAEYRGVYNKIHLRLSTHDAGGITAKDLDMAARIDGLETPGR